MSKKNTNPTVVLIIAHDFGNKRNHRYFTLLYDVMQTYQKSIRIVAFRLSDFTFTFHFHALEKEMATYSSILACRIPGTGEPGGLPSMGWHRVGHDWSDLVAESWRRRKKYEWKDQPRLPCGGWMSALPDKHLRSYQWIERDQETEKKI